MIGMVTILILILGFILLFRVMGAGERERENRMAQVVYGTDAGRVAEYLGVEPTLCPADDLAHLATSFPEGWPAASVAVTLERLASETHERRVYPLADADGEDVLCSAVEERTEVGVDADGAVIWSVAVLGRTPLVLPPWAEPGAVDR